MTEITAIADAITAALNAHSFSQAFTAVRGFRPENTPESLKTLTVWVIPISLKRDRASRTMFFWNHTIEIGIQKHLNSEANVAIDPLIALAREIDDFLTQTHQGGAAWISSEITPVIAYETLDSARVFTSVIRVTYQVVE